MTICYLSLGSNLKRPEQQLRKAIEGLRKTPGIKVIKVAKFYSNEAWGRKIQPRFFNTVVAIQTWLPPEALLSKCQKIEQQQGRQRRLKWGARTIDIDIVFYGKKIINKPHLVIPHPRFLERDFVLIPLQQIASLICLTDCFNHPTV